MGKKKWCEVCKFQTYGCQHLPDELDAARALEPQLIMLPEGIKRAVTQRETFLGFNTNESILPGHTVLLEASPQVIFRPHRLVVNPVVAPRFRLTGVRVGNMWQGASTMNVSCAIFGPHPDPAKFEPVKNLGQCDVCPIGMRIFLEVHNQSTGALDFDAVMYGEGLW